MPETTAPETAQADTAPLWCMHIVGPDDIHAAPDHWTALAWAAELNTAIAAKALKENWASDDNWPLTQAVVVQWQGTASEHAAALAKELAERAAHEVKRKAAAALATPTGGGTETREAGEEAAYQLGKEEGAADGIQRVAERIGIDSEYRWSSNPERSQPGAVELLERIVEHVAALTPATPAPAVDGVEALRAALEPFDKFSNTSFADSELCTIRVYARELRAVGKALATRTPAGAAGDPVGEDEEDWRDDPSADERWNAGLDFGMEQFCAVLGVDPKAVSWDAATETLDGDVCSVIGNILIAWGGDDWRDLATRPASPAPAASSIINQGMPTPRLQLRWAQATEEEAESFQPASLRAVFKSIIWTCHYELILPLRKGDTRRGRDGDPNFNVEVVLISQTMSLSSLNKEPSGPPYRDGHHAQWDSVHLGNLPVYHVASDGIFRLQTEVE